MMIDVLVLCLAPLLAFQGPKKAVDVTFRPSLAKRVKLIDQLPEAFTGGIKIRFVFDDERGSRGRVLRKRLLAEEFVLEDPSDRFPDECLLHRLSARRHLKRAGSVLHHLR